VDPAGFSAMPFLWGDKWIVICGVQVDGYCDRKRTKKVVGTDFNPLIPLASFMDLVQQHRANVSAQKSSVRVLSAVEAQEFVSFTMHEIRKLNLQIKSQAEELITKLNNLDVPHDARYQIQSIFGTSTLISTRLDAYDLHVNPDAFLAEKRKKISVYGKFEKARHCLSMLAQRSQVPIKCVGQTGLSIKGLQIFEILPFILLENAIKYSPADHPVEVVFRNTHSSADKSFLEVSTVSVGPDLLSGEAERVFENKFRGEYAKRVKVGTGTGLHFVKLVCDLHKIQVAVSSGEHVGYFNEVPYSKFCITLSIPLRAGGKTDSPKAEKPPVGLQFEVGAST